MNQYLSIICVLVTIGHFVTYDTTLGSKQVLPALFCK